MTDLCEVVITAPDLDWLVAFTRRLVEDNLCSGGHHIERIRSVYRWESDIYDKAEARVALHTRTALVPQIVERAVSEHPYVVPCVIALPIIAANPAYAQWVIEETASPVH